MKYFKLLFYTLIILALPLLMSLVALSAFALVFSIFSGLAPDIGTFIDQNILYLTAFTNVLTLFSIWLFFTIFNKPLKSTLLKQFKPIHSRYWVSIFLVGIFGIFLTTSISGLLNLSSLDPEAVKSLDTLIHSQNLPITLAIVGLFVPLVEELLFRGLLQTLYSKALPIGVAIVFQGLFFGIFHMNLVQALPTAILGIIFGLCVYYTRSLLTGIVLHGINNSLAVLIGYFNQNNLGKNTAEAIDLNAQNISLILMMLICSGFIYLLLKRIRAKSLLNE